MIHPRANVQVVVGQLNSKRAPYEKYEIRDFDIARRIALNKTDKSVAICDAAMR
jgi:hypothetical protein